MIQTDAAGPRITLQAQSPLSFRVNCFLKQIFLGMQISIHSRKYCIIFCLQLYLYWSKIYKFDAFLTVLIMIKILYSDKMWKRKGTIIISLIMPGVFPKTKMSNVKTLLPSINLIIFWTLTFACNLWYLLTYSWSIGST